MEAAPFKRRAGERAVVDNGDYTRAHRSPRLMDVTPCIEFGHGACRVLWHDEAGVLHMPTAEELVPSPPAFDFTAGP